MPYKYASSNKCDGWWDCLTGGEQVALLLGSGFLLTTILVAIILTARNRKR